MIDEARHKILMNRHSRKIQRLTAQNAELLRQVADMQHEFRRLSLRLRRANERIEEMEFARELVMGEPSSPEKGKADSAG